MDIGFLEIRNFFVVLLAICGAVAAIGGAATLLAKLWQQVRKPTIENAEALSEHEQYLAKDKHRIERLEEQAEEAARQNRLILRALVDLLRHEIDGNHIDRLADRATEIQDYLIEAKVI